MTKYDFSVLYAQYPSIIDQMKPVFGSHEFILELARQNQSAYVRALVAYLNPEGGEEATPFSGGTWHPGGKIEGLSRPGGTGTHR